MTGWERVPTAQDKLHIMVFGQDVKPIQEFIEEAMEHSVKKDDGKLCIYELHRWGLGWTKAQKKLPRALTSVVLDKTLRDDVINDIVKF